MTPNTIDWRLVGFSALWILGLSVLLATLSFADYTAHVERVRVRDALRRRSYQAAMFAGLMLFAAGVAGAAHSWWETTLWALLGCAFAFLAWRAWRASLAS
jgi:hypothetical protein